MFRSRPVSPRHAAAVLVAFSLFSTLVTAQAPSASPEVGHQALLPEVVAGAYSEQPAAHLWPAGAPGMDTWPGRLTAPVQESASANGGTLYNVVDPTYTAFIPLPARNTRTGVIVVPGGGFRQVSIESEGNMVARWLAERGIAAFVVKYRLVQQPGPQFSMMARMDDATVPMDVAGSPAVADGIEAIRQIRARAAEFGLEPDKIAVIGFSAGAHVAAYMMLNSETSLRPNYTALIYGAPFGGGAGTPRIEFPPIPAATAPDALPPFFMAMAQNDQLVGPTVRAFYDAVYAAGYRPETHLYLNGGHGFGMNPTNNTGRHFISQFFWWMESLGLTRKPGDPDRAAPPPGAGRGGRGGGGRAGP